MPADKKHIRPGPSGPGFSCMTGMPSVCGESPRGA